MHTDGFHALRYIHMIHIFCLKSHARLTLAKDLKTDLWSKFKDKRMYSQFFHTFSGVVFKIKTISFVNQKTLTLSLPQPVVWSRVPVMIYFFENLMGWIFWLNSIFPSISNHQTNIVRIICLIEIFVWYNFMRFV